MAKAQDVRPIIKLKSTAGTGYTYVTRKNRRNTPDRIVLKKYDPVVRSTSISERSAERTWLRSQRSQKTSSVASLSNAMQSAARLSSVS